MTNKERFRRAFLCLEADRAPYNFYFGPWGETLARWQREGLGEGNNDWGAQFGFDPGIITVPVNYGLLPGFPYTVLERKETTAIVIDGFGVTQEVSSVGSTIPKYLKFPVADIDGWIKYKKERLNPYSPGRFPENWAQVAENLNAYDGIIQLGCYPYGVFGTVREILGLENLMYAFYDDPELIHMIMDDLTDFWLEIYKQVCKDVKVDAIHIWEDMSGKQGSLVSPAHMYEFMIPNYKKIRRFADENGIHTVMLDTDGNVDSLIKIFMDGGINMLLPFEVNAGSDIVRYRREYPNLCILGGIDKIAVEKGKDSIDAEIERIKPMFSYPGYIPALDHLPHPGISWDDFRYFNLRLKEIIFGK